MWSKLAGIMVATAITAVIACITALYEPHQTCHLRAM